ncbi:STM4504/CBY_0614 family protein [Pseudomonas sp. Irchel 3H3]|uniref:STM4504/CBY_0614 family protein n=1 Tax=Pseudomonas sp. Irchel 3H3 TaxID=2009038 RepID=UPI000BA424C3|nr:hypothetical protein [Pseudomonas sp. Irchel 3H3]
MPIYDLYSKRQRKLRGEVPDVYVYDAFPNTLRAQLSYMIKDLLGDQDNYHHHRLRTPKALYDEIVVILKKEYGLHSLVTGYVNSSFTELHDFLLQERDVERCLDVVELCYSLGDTFARKYSYAERKNSNEHVDDCLNELNERFKEAGCGYELIDGKIIRIDSQLLHAEVVKPAIGFLNGEEYEGPRDEFLGAYEHYRHGNQEEALVDALKAFESTMKVILTANGKAYSAGDTASKLILACRDADLMPAYNESQLQSLVNVLTSGIPTLRNKNGGHGQGEAVRTVEPEIVAYGLHLAASAIVMLAGLEAKRRAAH